MITSADEYPIHQTAAPIAEAGGGHRNFYDRFFFNGYARDGGVFFALAMGQYPNRQVSDAAFSIIHRKRQYVLRASCRSGAERMVMRVGPVSIAVVEPLRVVRVSVAAGAGEISGELTFTARAPVIEEPRFHLEHDGHVFMDYTRLTQHTTVSGTLRVGTESISADGFWGVRDRSWGIRPIGERDASEPAPPPQFFWLWSPVHFDDLCTLWDVNEDESGSRWHQAAVIAPIGPMELEHAGDLRYRIDYRTGTRHARQAEVSMVRPGGERLEMTLTPLYNFHMSGIGYLHPQWGHGMYVGDDVVMSESWALDEIDPAAPLYLHVQAVCEARMGERRGIGVLEQLVLGPHRPSGFSGLFDPA